MLFAHYTTNYSQAKMLIKHLTNKGIKCHLAKDDRWYVVLAEFDAECHVRITIEDKFGIECDYNFGQVTEYDDFCFYDLPCVFSDFPMLQNFMRSLSAVILRSLNNLRHSVCTLVGC